MATLSSLQAGNRVHGEQYSAGNQFMGHGSARQISFRASPMLLASPGLFSYGCPQLVYYNFKHGFPTITAAQGSRKSGTRIFTSSKNEESTSDDKQQQNFGTQFFGFGRKPESSLDDDDEEEKEAELLPGTQFFRTIGGKVNDWNKTVRGGGQGLVPISSVPKDLAAFQLARRQDPNTVFVSGATGQIGARIAQRLLREGFSVRGGVRDLFLAQQLAEFATQYGVISREEAKRLNAVEFDLKNIESIAKAIGAATKVVVTIGPNEDGPKSKVSFEDASNVIEAAKLAKIANIVVVYEPGTGGTMDNPLAGLASFFSELFSKPVAVSLLELVDQIVDSELQYTVLKTASTEGVDDISPMSEFIDIRKESVTSMISTEQNKISKGQVASVVAEIISNPAVAENKVVEVFTSSAASAISKPITELLMSIPVDGRRERLFAARAKAEEEEKEQAERERVEAEARAAVKEARQAATLAAQLEAEAKKLAAEEARAASLAEKAQAQAAAAAASLDSLASRMKELGIPGVTSKSKGPSISPLAAAISTAKDGNNTNSPLLNFNAINNIQLPSFAKPVKAVADEDKEPSLASAASLTKSRKTRKPQPKPVVEESPQVAPAAKPQVNSIFGGLFQQETVYIDEV